MAERKVLQKYYPPDFDPAKIPRRLGKKPDKIKSRVMLPMTVQCSTCGEFVYKGRKFNALKETAQGETYLGIKIFRFHIKCSRCSANIVFKTDPKNSDYVCESGATRNYEPWKPTDEERAEQRREEEGKSDAMKALESRTMDSKQEMEILDALDEMRQLNTRLASVDTDQLLDAVDAKHSRTAVVIDPQQLLEEELGEGERFVRRVASDDEGDGAAGSGGGGGGSLEDSFSRPPPSLPSRKAINKRKKKKRALLAGYVVVDTPNNDTTTKPSSSKRKQSLDNDTTHVDDHPQKKQKVETDSDKNKNKNDDGDDGALSLFAAYA